LYHLLATNKLANEQSYSTKGLLIIELNDKA